MYIVMENMGEGNDAIENDIMTLKKDVIEHFSDQGINKYILIAENVLNFHGSDREYYEEWREELQEDDGWAVLLNMPEQTQYDFKKLRLERYLELVDLPDWRIYKPIHLFRKIQSEQERRLS